MDDRDEAGRFAVGNRFWEHRSSHGRKPTFSDPDQLRDACAEYFASVTDNPLIEEKLFSYEGSVTRAETGKMQAMTIVGMCLFLDITRQTWTAYKDNPDLADVCEWAEAVIWQQKFSGAAAGLLNPSLVARELGLADKQEHTGGVTISVSKEDAEL
ncbi:terminase small subunit [Tranquillimonas rosea]|uniref:terminase small subunit n=1 Tax=Tranquillimonas rosea TaxID=641238 RepID=UPI003BA97CC8